MKAEFGSSGTVPGVWPEVVSELVRGDGVGVWMGWAVCEGGDVWVCVWAHPHQRISLIPLPKKTKRQGKWYKLQSEAY